MRPVDHLNALRAFEATARHLSFVTAAQELFVTPAAVGQLVRSLESSLNVTLFHRLPSGPSRLELTAEAQLALPDIQAGLEHLAVALRKLRAGQGGELIRITLPPAFADKWLLPRLERFHELFPSIELELETGGKLIDFKAERIDIGIRFGDGQWQGMSATLLIKDDYTPVCSPTLISKERPLKSPSDLRFHTLIHDSSTEANDLFPSWQSWLAIAGVSELQPARSIRINNSSGVVQAALNGAGVALGRSCLVSDDLASGRLVQPFDIVQSPSLAYYIVTSTGRAATKGVEAFSQWLLDEAAHEKVRAPSTDDGESAP